MFNLKKRSNYNKSRRTNQKQKHILYAAMATNRRILECRSGDLDARRARKAIWKRVVMELNMAGPNKDLTQWRKVWTDLRLGMRKKWDKARKSKYVLTEYERRVINACGMVDKPGEEYSYEKDIEDMNSFLDFLQEEEAKEHEPVKDYSGYLTEESSRHISDYYNDSSELIACQPTEVNVKEEFEEETINFVVYEEPSVECISDDEDEPYSPGFEDYYKQPSVECISDDDEPIITSDKIKLEPPSDVAYEALPQTETVPRPIPLHVETVPTVPQPIQIQCPEMPPMPSSPRNNINIMNLPRRKKLKDATLKEIKKMHRNLLRESKKQTALLKKLVQECNTN